MMADRVGLPEVVAPPQQPCCCGDRSQEVARSILSEGEGALPRPGPWRGAAGSAGGRGKEEEGCKGLRPGPKREEELEADRQQTEKVHRHQSDPSSAL